jgi:hypothetical protein
MYFLGDAGKPAGRTQLRGPEDWIVRKASVSIVILFVLAGNASMACAQIIARADRMWDCPSSNALRRCFNCFGASLSTGSRIDPIFPEAVDGLGAILTDASEASSRNTEVLARLGICVGSATDHRVGFG